MPTLSDTGRSFIDQCPARRVMTDRNPTTEPTDPGLGRALRWALAALALVASATIFLVIKNSPPLFQSHGEEASLPNDAPLVRFRDITAEAGITFHHFNGARGEKLLPETMGAGAAFCDFDGDGDQDLLFVNATEWPWNRDASRIAHTAALYRNDGRGRFDDVTNGS